MGRCGGLKDGIGEAPLGYANCLASAVAFTFGAADHGLGVWMPASLAERSSARRLRSCALPVFGAVSHRHTGVLFSDDALKFQPAVIEALRADHLLDRAWFVSLMLQPTRMASLVFPSSQPLPTARLHVAS